MILVKSGLARKESPFLGSTTPPIYCIYVRVYQLYIKYGMCIALEGLHIALSLPPVIITRTFHGVPWRVFWQMRNLDPPNYTSSGLWITPAVPLVWGLINVNHPRHQSSYSQLMIGVSNHLRNA